MIAARIEYLMAIEEDLELFLEDCAGDNYSATSEEIAQAEKKLKKTRKKLIKMFKQGIRERK